jgi:hypothetical protein
VAQEMILLGDRRGHDVDFVSDDDNSSDYAF